MLPIRWFPFPKHYLLPPLLLSQMTAFRIEIDKKRKTKKQRGPGIKFPTRTLNYQSDPTNEIQNSKCSPIPKKQKQKQKKSEVEFGSIIHMLASPCLRQTKPNLVDWEKDVSP
jgi:hypothetical protein